MWFSPKLDQAQGPVPRQSGVHEGMDLEGTLKSHLSFLPASLQAHVEIFIFFFKNSSIIVLMNFNSFMGYRSRGDPLNQQTEPEKKELQVFFRQRENVFSVMAWRLVV